MMGFLFHCGLFFAGMVVGQKWPPAAFVVNKGIALLSVGVSKVRALFKSKQP